MGVEEWEGGMGGEDSGCMVGNDLIRGIGIHTQDIRRAVDGSHEEGHGEGHKEGPGEDGEWSAPDTDKGS